MVLAVGAGGVAGVEVRQEVRQGGAGWGGRSPRRAAAAASRGSGARRQLRLDSGVVHRGRLQPQQGGRRVVVVAGGAQPLISRHLSLV